MSPTTFLDHAVESLTARRKGRKRLPVPSRRRRPAPGFWSRGGRRFFARAATPQACRLPRAGSSWTTDAGGDPHWLRPYVAWVRRAGARPSAEPVGTGPALAPSRPKFRTSSRPVAGPAVSERGAGVRYPGAGRGQAASSGRVRVARGLALLTPRGGFRN